MILIIGTDATSTVKRHSLNARNCVCASDMKTIGDFLWPTIPVVNIEAVYVSGEYEVGYEVLKQLEEKAFSVTLPAMPSITIDCNNQILKQQMLRCVDRITEQYALTKGETNGLD